MNPIAILALISALQKEVVLLQAELAQQTAVVQAYTPPKLESAPQTTTNAPCVLSVLNGTNSYGNYQEVSWRLFGIPQNSNGVLTYETEGSDKTQAIGGNAQNFTILYGDNATNISATFNGEPCSE